MFWPRNNVSSFPATPSAAPQARHGGRIPALAELPVHANAEHFTVTGSGNVKRLPTWPAGTRFKLTFTGSPTFVHSTKLKCPGGANKQFSPNDSADLVAIDNKGTWVLYSKNASQGSILNQANVLDFGADPTGTLSSQTAFDNAAAALVARGGGKLYVPAGVFYLPSGLVISTANISVDIEGAGMMSSYISVGANNVTGIDINGARHSISNISVIGYNATNASAFGVRVRSGCVDVLLDRIQTYYSSVGIFNEGADTYSRNLLVRKTYSTLFYNTGPAPWFDRCKFDNQWISVPAAGSTFTARANSTAYSLNDVRSFGGFWHQCTQAGTSGGSTPTAQPYDSETTDGTVKWKLVCGQNSNALSLTTGTSEAHLTHVDCTGAQGGAAISINNNGVGVAPWIIDMKGVIASQSLGAGIDAIAGKGLMIGAGCEIASGLTSTQSAISLRSSWVGDCTITGATIFGGTSNGIYVAAGVGVFVSNCLFGGFTNAAISLDTNVGDVFVQNCNLGSSQQFGVNAKPFIVGSGTGSRIRIINNRVSGATGSGTNSSSGTNNDVTTGNV